MAQVQYAGTGRRKNSVARVRLVPGTGKITMNGKDVRDYLPYENLITDLSQPFGITETTGSYDVLVNVNGGGFLVRPAPLVWHCPCPVDRRSRLPRPIEEGRHAYP